MSDFGYVAVKNYERFQHYKDRNPPWIKFYVALLDDYEFSRLQDASKMHLVGIWLLASKCENRVPADPEWIARRIGATDPVNLQVLVDAGFLVRLRRASDVLADDKQSAMPETEAEAETKSEKKTNASHSGAARLEESAPTQPPAKPAPLEDEMAHGEFMKAMRKVCSGKREAVTEADMDTIGSIAKRMFERNWTRRDIYRAAVGWRAKIDRGEVKHIPAGSKFTLAKLYDADPAVDQMQVGLDVYHAASSRSPPEKRKAGQPERVDPIDIVKRFSKEPPEQKGAA